MTQETKTFDELLLLSTEPVFCCDSETCQCMSLKSQEVFKSCEDVIDITII